MRIDVGGHSLRVGLSSKPSAPTEYRPLLGLSTIGSEQRDWQVRVGTRLPSSP
jgi:hypothetical protein